MPLVSPRVCYLSYDDPGTEQPCDPNFYARVLCTELLRSAYCEEDYHSQGWTCQAFSYACSMSSHRM